MKRILREDLPVQLTLANVLGFALTFLAVPIIAREIGPVGRGETAAALAAFAIAPTLLGVGMPLELRRRASAGAYRDSVRAARDILVLLTPLAAAVGLLLAFTLFRDSGAPLQVAVVAGLGLAPMSVSWAIDAATLAGLGKYRAIAMIRVAHPAITLLLVSGIAAIGELTASLVVWSSIGATLATAVVGWCIVRVGLRGSRASRVALSRSSIRFAGSAIAESATSRLDQILVLPLIGAAAAGQYSIAASLALLPLALGQALAAEHFRVAASIRPAEAHRAYSSKALRESLAVGVPSVALFGILATPLIPLVFGKEFSPAALVFVGLLPGSIFLVVGFVASMLLAAQGRGGTMTLLQVGALVLGIVLLFALAPSLGATGAALASSASLAALFVGQSAALMVRAKELVPHGRDLVDGLRSLYPRR